MKYLISIAIIINIAHRAFTQTCPKHLCASEDNIDKMIENSICVDVISKTEYQFAKCKDTENYYCPYVQGTNYASGTKILCAKKSFKTFDLIFGQACDEDSQCLSKHCKSGKCKGEDYEGKCFGNSGNCKYALFCNSTMTCDHLRKEKSQCTNTFECESDLICYLNTCARPFTLDNGAQVDSKQNAKMCKSNRVREVTNLLGNSLYFCDSILLQDKSKNQCTESQVSCTYTWATDSSKTISLPCICDMTAQGNKWCPRDDSSEYIEEEAWKYVTVSKANTLLRDYSNFDRLKQDRYYPNKNMEKCVAEVLNYSSYLSIVYMSLILIFGVLF